MLRVSSFNEGLGEPEQDANSALTELDKGLRSGKVGEQCEAIVRFPRLFERYPFPILINASLLKLAEVFRMGNNFLRLCVLRVCQQSEKHLDKVSNVDEFVRRVYSVMHSNDPVARAVTLRTFGAVAAIIPERQHVHHSIRRSLDSHDSVEVEAAVHAAIQFAAQSKTFAVSMCNKVSDMIQGQSTPADLKLQLIPILQYMHHDTSTAAMVRALCLELLPGYPAQDFIIVILNTLTKLAAATLVDIPSQVNLLLKYLREDPRWEVKSKALHHLYDLAKPGAHLWPPNAIDDMIEFVLSTKQVQILSLAFSVLRVLVESPRMCHEHRGANSKLQELCAKHCYSPHVSVAVQAVQILTDILCYCFKENLEPHAADDVVGALEALILILMFAHQKHLRQLKVALKCAVRLCEAKHDYCETFMELLGSRLGNIRNEYTVVVCEALGAIGSFQHETLLPLLGDILEQLRELADVKDPDKNQTKTKIMLCTLVFQTICGYNWNKEAESTISKVVQQKEDTDLWANYCIARAAVRYGHHAIACRVFGQLAEAVSSEHSHFWLVCLRELSRAEALLSDSDVDLVRRLDGAAARYGRAAAALRAAATPQYALAFQAEYVRLRAELAQCAAQLLHACGSLCVVPPPAIAAAIAQSTRDEHQRHGYVTNRLRACARDFRACADLHWRLYQTAFDADPASLDNLQMLQQICTLMERCVESVCGAGGSQQGDPPRVDADNVRLELRQLTTACTCALAAERELKEDAAAASASITHKQVEILHRAVGALAAASLPLPRFFFQTLQQTSVKLAVSPQPRAAAVGELVAVPAGAQLAVRVEGVLQHSGARAGLFRTAARIALLVQATPHTAATATSKTRTEADAAGPPVAELKREVAPHHDFFSSQFLVAFPRGGQYAVTVEASIVDEAGDTWRTGPRAQLLAKVADEQRPAPVHVPGMQAGGGNVILMPEDTQFARTHQKKPA